MKDLIIFDMDGVLVDVNASYREAIRATVKHFTGYEPSHHEIQDWKNRGGWNDDWQLSTRMIQEHGGNTPYPEVVDYFQQLFHGNGDDALILREEWLAADGLFDRLAEQHHLAVFTGRLRWEANVTLNRFHPDRFDPVVGADDVVRSKPDPEGLHKICASLAHGKCWYVGDTVDDARASSAARIPFVGIAARANPRYDELVQLLRAEGAVAVLDDINSLEAAIAHR
jgi:HAD superfamily hydrolase (TIGR01548 family)